MPWDPATHFADGVVAWSSGNSLSLSFLAFADTISLSCRTLLQEYLRTIVVYDSPTRTTGAVYPPGVLPYSPFVDTTLTPKEAMEVFPRWNSGYYTHSPDVFASFSATSFETLPGRAQILSGLVMTYTLDEQPEPTITRIPANVLEDATDPESTLRSRQPDPRIFLEVFRECRRKALYDAEWAKSYFPNVKVEVVTFTKTLADCVYAAWDILHDLLEVRAQRGPQDGERKVGFHVLEGVNHHAHWDYPERVLDLFSKII
ncbi:hypothetical protein NLI96_g3429 [Meripilus lineatus]|uniref:Alpha/beta-hydrolase n=1 Tax=Meripilus lineatus TaxID=2056292 RepID=A0AAD5YGL1_9APHY|nr:hypothetical protein NLI96_g3429 [Physisporinus lineatus]